VVPIADQQQRYNYYQVMGNIHLIHLAAWLGWFLTVHPKNGS
jgi:hypothetical protein